MNSQPALSATPRRLSGIVSTLAMCLCSLSLAATDDFMVPHVDPLQTDARLTLREVVEETFQRYPQGSLIAALEDEHQALNRRSNSLIAGYPLIYLQWIDDRVFNDRGEIQVQTGYQIRIWMWSQRSASRNVAERAEKATGLFAAALTHEIAGLVRDALWKLSLADNRHELANQVYDVSLQTFKAVKRRVELGDLARSDHLLAESDHLEKKTLMTVAEADVMHARQAYSNLTRLEKAPANFAEERSSTTEISEQHPAVAAAAAMIERAQAEVEFQNS